MMRPTSRGSTTSLASAGRNILGLKGPAEAHTPSKPDEPAREARESTWREGRGSTLDKGLRDDLMRIFLQLDEDGDGVLNQKESAATKQLVALACGKDERARGVSVKQALGDAQGRADDFMSYVVAVSKQSQIPVPEILKRMNQALMLARRPSKFDESVNELRHALVRNVSNLPDDPLAAIPLWRTATGSSFPLPPGAASGPMICGVAFKAMQYLAARTEDAGIIEAALTAKMAAHRPMFKKLFDQAGEILGISRPERSTLDLFLGKPDSEDFLRVRLKEVSLSSGPEPLLDGIGGFDVGHVEERDVPGDLWAEMRKTKAEVPEHPKLARATSQLTDNDLQNVSLVLTAAPVGRHTFKIRLRLLGNKLVPNYILMVPKLSTKGHCRYSSHKVTMLGKEPVKAAFECGSFLLFNARGDQLSDLVLEHEFLNQRVRVQPKSSAVISEVVPVPELSEEERLNNLACNPRVRSVLESLGLDRKGGERDIAFAMRLGRALRSGYAYDAEATEAELSDLTTVIWEKSRGDCSAFNAGFVYALRAFGIPARVSLGFKYGTAVRDACGAVVAPHAQAEFFADGVGWVPCDATTGVRRFGHEATEVLSFIEWRPANAALEEVNEMHKFIQADYHSFQPLRAQLEGDGWADKPMPPEKFGKMVAEATKQSESSALGQIKQVMHLCKGEPKIPSATRMADLLAAWELGQFRELGTGNGLTESARAGLKIFEGGPFSGRPLRKAEINENMLVPDQIDAVMEHVGAKSTKDWPKFWPFGVFSCNYEFTHQPP